MFPDYLDFRYIWASAGLFGKLFYLTLLVIVVHALISGVSTIWRLRLPTSHDYAKVVKRRLRNQRQILGAMFYFYGFLVITQLLTDLGHTSSKNPTQTIVLTELSYLAIAGCVLFVFLVVHLIQWLVSARIHKVLEGFEATPAA